ncbi:MAG: prephenate/arogenate dehydrogenase [Okeania sp. SIO2H7]|mgnify:CR=1 FL=1|nr:prephenate/arogenate dehydrogenase [Okeania sp. SIO2H7]
MNIGIVGLGLIGGSMGLDFKALGHQVLGVSRRDSTCQKAVELGVVDEASTDLSLLSAADLVVICTPIGAIAPTVELLISHLSADAILTDVGSVKAAVIDAVSPLWPNFVGGHPMAGKAESGLEVAEFGLFVGRPYVITPTKNTPPTVVQTVEEMARSLKANVFRCDPEEHDRAVAWISHLPVMASAGLIAACMGESNPAVLKLAQNLASSGFRDTSRVGGGNPELGLMMAKYNRGELLRSLLSYRDCLDQFIDRIENEDWDGLFEDLQDAYHTRRLFVKD